MADISIVKPKKSNFVDPVTASIAAYKASPAGQAAAAASQQPALSTDPIPSISFTMNKRKNIDNPQEYDSSCRCGRAECGNGDPERSGENDCGGHCNGVVWNKQHWRKCLKRDPGWETLYCPAWGPVVAVPEVGSSDIKCTYQYIKPEFAFGAGSSAVAEYFDAAVAEDYQKKYCYSLRNPDDLLAKKNDCKELFGAGTDVEFDKRMLDLCTAVSGNGWASMNDSCVETARRSVTNKDSNASKAGALMNKFCRGGDGTDKTATGTGNNRSDPRCGCINAHDLGFKGDNSCLVEANRALPGCDKMYTKMKLLVESGGQQGMAAIQTISTDPGCISSDCALAKDLNDQFKIFPYYGSADCPSVQFNICDITIQQKVAVNSAVQAQCNFPDDGGPAQRAGTGAPGAASAPGMAPDEEPASELPITWKPFAKIFNTETKQYAFASACCATCLLLIVLLIFIMKGPSGPSSSNMLAAKLASI
jgi:hypothetical protein